MKALLGLRRPLTPPEMLLLRQLFEDGIYDTCFPEARRTLKKWGLHGDELLLDLTQETLMRLWDTCVAQGLPDSLVAKVRGLAMGLALNHGTREKRSPVTDRGLPSSGSDKLAASVRPIDRALDLKEVVRTLFHALKPKHRAVVDALVFRDLSYDEAAAALDLPKSTVTTRFKAAIDKLRELAPDLLSPSQRDLV
jgi:RNA polymerase sigma factor (sigma-70 family)